MEEKLKVRGKHPGLPIDTHQSTQLTRSKVWDIVFEAQTQSVQHMRENFTAASVDIAARDVITEAGYGEAFTHRVGHGIGIKGNLARSIPN